MTDINKICHRCDGQGQVDTGIDESPVTVCNYCNGTGVNPLYQAGLDAAMAQQPKQEHVAYSHTQMKIIAESNYDAGYKKGVKDAHVKQNHSEPVAIVYEVSHNGYLYREVVWKIRPHEFPIGTEIYTTPQQRKPLTDEQIMECAWGLFEDANSVPVRYFARAIEAAHGIKE
jgi:hypothetical protein